MKKTILIILAFLASSYAFSQTRKKTDSIFYLLDTAKTPVKDRMWELGMDGQFKYYAIQCTCMDYQSKPTFIDRLDDKGKYLDKSDIKNIQFVSIQNLIAESKKNAKTKIKNSKAFFIIEPEKGKYLIHKVFLIEPRKPEITY